MKQLIYILPVCLGLLLTYDTKGQTAATDNKISESITFHDMPKGLAVYGIFEGRSPCEPIARQIGSVMPTGCDHLKWQLILFRDTVTLKPATYLLRTEMFSQQPLKGKWSITHGTKHDPAAAVFVLDYSGGKSLHLLKGDENVLFILDENLEFLTGDANFSYTLNRVHKVRHLSGK